MMQVAPKSVFITGANRGLGLEFVRQLLDAASPPKHLIAACRSPDKATDLKNLAEKNANLKVMKFDADDLASLPALEKSVSEVVGEDGINLLLNNAAVLSMTTLETVTEESAINSFKINMIAPLMLTKTLLPHLKKTAASSPDKVGYQHSMIVNISTKVASIDDNKGGQLYDYRISKTALNMMSKNLSLDLEPQGILVFLLHPGWVATDMGGSQATTQPNESVKGMLKVIASAAQKDSGKFYDFKGEAIPW